MPEKRLSWDDLLSTKRTRGLMGGRPSEVQEVESRTPFERDYGRVVFSTPVRRLQDKTQVFPLEKNDSVRTRLTHSMEVSSVARGLTRRAVTKVQEYDDQISDEVIKNSTEIAATVGLIHDIGNPPFGHAGEEAMQSWFEKVLSKDKNKIFKILGGKESQLAKDFTTFEGNAQTLRLLGRLQILADHHGLNLTAATFCAACKYVAASNEIKDFHDQSKPGYFVSEKELIEKVRNETGVRKARSPITFLVEASDDAVFSVADLEDGIKKGLITWDILCDRLKKSDAKELASTLIKRTEDYIDGSHVEFTHREREQALAQMFQTNVIGAHVEAAANEFASQYDAIMNRDYRDELLKTGDTAALLKECKDIAIQYVYKSNSILKLEIYGRNVLHDLMDLLWEGASGGEVNKGDSFSEKIYSLLSSNYKKIYEHENKKGMLPKEYLQLQLVGDYVAGMTDSFATYLHSELFDRQ